MVIELTDGEQWDYSPPAGGHANLLFASASSPNDARILIEFIPLDGEPALVDLVYLRVPHSWWLPAQPLGPPSYADGDVLRVTAKGGAVAFRIDLDEFDAGS